MGLVHAMRSNGPLPQVPPSIKKGTEYLVWLGKTTYKYHLFGSNKKALCLFNLLHYDGPLLTTIVAKADINM